MAAIWWPPLLPPRQVPSLSFGEDAPGSNLMPAFLAPVGMRTYGPANLAIPPRASRYEPGSRHGIHPVASFSFSLSLNDVGLRQGNDGVSRKKTDREGLSIRTFVRNVTILKSRVTNNGWVWTETSRGRQTGILSDYLAAGKHRLCNERPGATQQLVSHKTCNMSGHVETEAHRREHGSWRHCKQFQTKEAREPFHCPADFETATRTQYPHLKRRYMQGNPTERTNDASTPRVKRSQELQTSTTQRPREQHALHLSSLDQCRSAQRLTRYRCAGLATSIAPLSSGPQPRRSTRDALVLHTGQHRSGLGGN